MSELRLYNTLSRGKQRFEPLEPGRVRMYSCGPTVYGRQHLGNMRAYLFADLLRRTLEYTGYQVRHVINITDVGHLVGDTDSGEDKVEAAARRAGESAREITERWTRVFQADLSKLHVKEPAIWCRATDHIAEQLEMVRVLEARGFTYRTSDGIYFDTSKDPHYGELGQRDLAGQQVGERIDTADEKRNPADFALWKLSPRDGPRRQMEWESPWGRGFPGWHLECSAMSTKYLGAPFDIHTGGVDHIAPHHTNEIAQSENVFDVRPWVRYWLHEAFMLFDGEKVSKSKGHTLSLDDLEAAGIEPLAFRLFFLGAHYRQQQTFTDEAMRSAQVTYERLVRHAVGLRDAAERGGEPQAAVLRERFREALCDDLNAPQALALLWEALRSPELGGAVKWELVCEFDAVLGLGLDKAELPGLYLDAEIEALVQAREQARRERDFARADAIRDDLRARGIALEDTPQGVRWRRA